MKNAWTKDAKLEDLRSTIYDALGRMCDETAATEALAELLRRLEDRKIRPAERREVR